MTIGVIRISMKLCDQIYAYLGDLRVMRLRREGEVSRCTQRRTYSYCFSLPIEATNCDVS